MILQLLNVLIGLTLVYVIFSTIASALFDSIEIIVKRRGELLARGIAEILRRLSDNVDADVERFYEHSLINSLYEGGFEKHSRKLPSYIPPVRFARAVLMLAEEAVAKDESASGPFVRLRAYAERLVGQRALAPGETLVAAMEAELVDHFNTSMDRVSGWFARYARGVLLVIGLSLEDEARQVAEWAASEQPVGQALVLTGRAAWQQRLSGAFSQRWAELGRMHATVELPAEGGYVDGNALAELRARLSAEPPQLVYAALDANGLRQVRMAIGTSLPTYGTASVNPGLDMSSVPAELVGVRFLDLPWTVQPDHPAVAGYPRWSNGGQGLDPQRLYALGIDAYRIARELAQRPTGAFELDGATGRLSVNVGQGDRAFRRVETGVVVRDNGPTEESLTDDAGGDSLPRPRRVFEPVAPGL